MKAEWPLLCFPSWSEALTDKNIFFSGAKKKKKNLNKPGLDEAEAEHKTRETAPHRGKKHPHRLSRECFAAGLDINRYAWF